MKFFLPVQETKVAEESYQAIKQFIEKQTGWPVSDKRYYEIHYRHNDQDLHVRVGGPDPLNGEQVFAIFKPQNPSSPFLVCTYSRGVCKANQFWPVMRRRSSLSQKASSTENQRATRMVNGGSRHRR
jgi:hypothetical protein